jgi:putative nucleotidyltransferase with HDIG domain
MTDIQKIVKGIAGLKPISHVVNKIMAVTQDPDSSMSELAEIISFDAMATANLLKAANSAYYGCPKKFDSIHQAIVFLGMEEVVDLVLMTSSAENLKRPQKGYGLTAGDLWRYSVASALLARKLATAKEMADVHFIFTAALLKDIGKVVMEQYVDDSRQKIQALVAQGDFSFREAEKAVLGIDHAELGAMVARVWQFSPKMVEIIGNHHHPARAAEAGEETAIVYASDLLCMMMGINSGLDGLAYRFDRQVIESIGLTPTGLQVIIADFAQELHKVEELIAA